MRAAIHTRACLSIAKLCALAWLVQIASSPQYGDGCAGGVLRLARRLRIAHLQLDLRRRCASSDRRPACSRRWPRARRRSVRSRFTVGLRLSLAISSCRYAFGSAQSHIVTTTLRSRPCGRGGAAAGSSPPAMRSVQSAHIASARCRPTCVKRALMPPPAWPDWMRRSHAAREVSNVPRFSGISRVALLPI